jgi:hypothetical protein
MSRNPVSYPTLVKSPASDADEPAAVPEEEPADESDLLRDVAARLMIYVHPAATKTLKRYALEQSGHRATVRVHDLVIESLEAFFEKNGLPGPVRAKEPTPKAASKKRRNG